MFIRRAALEKCMSWATARKRRTFRKFIAMVGNLPVAQAINTIFVMKSGTTDIGQA
jgi:hypothetical protein